MQVHSVLGGTLTRLPALLKADAGLRAETVGHLMTLATPQRVRALMANAALGKLWRAVAAFRRHDERVAELCNRFGAAVQGDVEMQAWVESTYMMQARPHDTEPHGSMWPNIVLQPGMHGEQPIGGCLTILL